MDRLLHSFPARKTVARIKSENSIGLIRPIQNCCVIVGYRTGVTQRLRFGQIGFATAEQVRGLLALIDVDRHAVPLDNATLLVAQRLATGLMPTKLAVRPT